MIRDELPQQTYLQLAIWYNDLNLPKESKTILETAPQKDDEMRYWQAWLNRNNADKKELLAKAGHPQGLDIKLYFSPDRYPKAKEVCQVIADQLAKAGIKAELVSQEFAVFWGKEGVNGGKTPFYYVGRPASDADTVYDQYFRSGVSPRIQYKNPEFYKLIDEEQGTGQRGGAPELPHHVARSVETVAGRPRLARLLAVEERDPVRVLPRPGRPQRAGSYGCTGGAQ